MTYLLGLELTLHAVAWQHHRIRGGSDNIPEGIAGKSGADRSQTPAVSSRHASRVLELCSFTLLSRSPRSPPMASNFRRSKDKEPTIVAAVPASGFVKRQHQHQHCSRLPPNNIAPPRYLNHCQPLSWTRHNPGKYTRSILGCPPPHPPPLRALSCLSRDVLTFYLRCRPKGGVCSEREMQCGGVRWNGPTCCWTGHECEKQSE